MPAAAAPRTVRETVLGVVGVLMVIGAVATLLLGGEGDTGTAPGGPPAIEILRPAPGDTVRGPLDIVFRPAAELAPTSAGWGTGSLHLHLRLDGADYMPGAADIAREPAGAFRWSFAALPPGPHRLRLFWSGADHRPIEGGGSAEIEVRSE